MNRQLKSSIKRIISPKIVNRFWVLLSSKKIYDAEKIFQQAQKEPAWLGLSELESFQKQFPHPPEYCYDHVSLELRGRERTKEILRRSKHSKSFLELGCWDGMVSCTLQNHGKATTAIDIRSEGFDQRAINAGVKFLKMDAEHLEFSDGSFDFIFSYDAFEHFQQPELVLKEATRVVKRGGYVYLVFGPLYMSAKGLHAYRSITVPYCQFLFRRELLEDFVQKNNLEPINFGQLNYWSLEDYRELWKHFSGTLKVVKYYEGIDPTGLDIIMKYPSCFKSKTTNFDGLIVSTIEVLLEKV